MRNILKYLFTGMLLISFSACSEQDVLNNGLANGTGSIQVRLAIPASIMDEVTRAIPGTPGELVGYPTDFQVSNLNIYLFNNQNTLVKNYVSVSNNLSQDTPNLNITLADAPAGNDQTLLCVANPNLFPELVDLAEGTTLDDVLRLTSRTIEREDSLDVTMFMLGKSGISVIPGTTNHVSASLIRGVARLDIFTVDEHIEVESVTIAGVPSFSYLGKQEQTPELKVVLQQDLEDFNERCKVGYLNESGDITKVEIYFTRNGIPGIVNLNIPTVVRNNVYTINLETPNGTHQVAGSLSIAEWTSHVLEGQVDSSLTLDRNATISSFQVEGIANVTVLNDTTLLLPKGEVSGTLFFNSGAEVGTILMNQQDTTVLTINRNAVTRGNIQTSFDITVKPYGNLDTNAEREARIWVSNLLTGKGRVFIIRQKATGYLEINVPLLSFENSHQYVDTVLLPGVNQVSELTLPADPAFDIEVSKLDMSDNYLITINKKRVFDSVAAAKQLLINKNGTPVVLFNLAADRGFVYEEVELEDGLVFMDRDLGAISPDSPGELFIPSLLKPLDQGDIPGDTQYGFPFRGYYSGGGRLTGGFDLSKYANRDYWFITRTYAKDIRYDPCPEGWHVMSNAEITRLFTQSAVGIGEEITTGAIGGKALFNENIITYTTPASVNNPGKSIKFVAKTGYWDSRVYKPGANGWPTAWWTVNINNSRLWKLTFNIEPATREIQISNKDLLTVSRPLAFLIRCVKDANN